MYLRGFLIASCMDIIVAADDAKFLASHLQLCTAPWDLGIRNAKRVLYENRFVTAQEAQAMGLVSEVTPRAQLEATVLAQAERWAETDLLTLRMIKQSVNNAQDTMGYRTALHAAHSTYMVLEMTRAEREAHLTPRDRQLGGVAAALRKTAAAPA